MYSVASIRQMCIWSNNSWPLLPWCTYCRGGKFHVTKRRWMITGAFRVRFVPNLSHVCVRWHVRWWDPKWQRGSGSSSALRTYFTYVMRPFRWDSLHDPDRPSTRQAIALKNFVRLCALWWAVAVVPWYHRQSSYVRVIDRPHVCECCVPTGSNFIFGITPRTAHSWYRYNYYYLWVIVSGVKRADCCHHCYYDDHDQYRYYYRYY